MHQGVYHLCYMLLVWLVCWKCCRGNACIFCRLGVWIRNCMYEEQGVGILMSECKNEAKNFEVVHYLGTIPCLDNGKNDCFYAGSSLSWF